MRLVKSFYAVLPLEKLSRPLEELLDPPFLEKRNAALKEVGLPDQEAEPYYEELPKHMTKVFDPYPHENKPLQKGMQALSYEKSLVKEAIAFLEHRVGNGQIQDEWSYKNKSRRVCPLVKIDIISKQRYDSLKRTALTPRALSSSKHKHITFPEEDAEYEDEEEYDEEYAITRRQASRMNTRGEKRVTERVTTIKIEGDGEKHKTRTLTFSEHVTEAD